MRYKIFLILFLLLYVAQTAAGEKRYRVEILVLSHLHHEAIPSEAGSIRDFTNALDFLNVEDEDDDEAEDDEATRDEDSGAELPIADQPGINENGVNENGLDETGIDESEPEEPWADVIAVQDMSDVMRETWRRLRLSAPFRPEQYLAWEQSADEPFPSLRIHDQEVVLIDDPYADLRETDADEAVEEEEEEEAVEDQGVELKVVADREVEDRTFVFTDQVGLLPGDVHAKTIEEILKEYEEEPELPDPTFFYRLDGTVMLRRSRFLHLEIDIELRQAVFDEQPLTAPPVLSDESEPAEPELPLPTSFLIHQLQQTRQVKSQRMEYFDSPVLGVLLWITPFELEDEADSFSD